MIGHRHEQFFVLHVECGNFTRGKADVGDTLTILKNRNIQDASGSFFRPHLRPSQINFSNIRNGCWGSGCIDLPFDPLGEIGEFLNGRILSFRYNVPRVEFRFFPLL